MEMPDIPEIEMFDEMQAFGTYEEVLKHIAERHGEIGLSIVKDPNQPPFGWHQFAHVLEEMGAGTWDHEHIGVNNEGLGAFMSRLEALIQDPEFIEILQESINSTEFAEATKATKKYIEELD